MAKFIDLHCVHNSGEVSVQVDKIVEVRRMTGPIVNTVSEIEAIDWTRIKVTGSTDIEIEERYEDILEMIRE